MKLSKWQFFLFFSFVASKTNSRRNYFKGHLLKALGLLGSLFQLGTIHDILCKEIKYVLDISLAEFRLYLYGTGSELEPTE